MADCLIVESREGVSRLTLNRPERRNALSRDLLLRLEDSQAAIRTDRSIRAVVLAGAGPVFCAGHDLAELASGSEHDYRELFELCSRVMLGFRRLEQPVIRGYTAWQPRPAASSSRPATWPSLRSKPPSQRQESRSACSARRP